MTRKLLAVVAMLLPCPAVSQESGPPGSGYAGMDGDVINYEYYDFGGFQLFMSEHRLKWRGAGGLFDGVVAEVNPQVSRVADDATIVGVGACETSHATHATQIAEDVFFISWGGAHGGNHIVFNAATMKVYDQIMPDGTRREAIYDANCFDMPAMC